MVTIIDYRVHKNAEGKPFCSLLLQGDLELVRSKETGKFYATARKASMTSTFTEDFCKQLIGQRLPGGIAREDSEPYVNDVLSPTGSSSGWQYNRTEKNDRKTNRHIRVNGPTRVFR